MPKTVYVDLDISKLNEVQDPLSKQATGLFFLMDVGVATIKVGDNSYSGVMKKPALCQEYNTDADYIFMDKESNDPRVLYLSKNKA